LLWFTIIDPVDHIYEINEKVKQDLESKFFKTGMQNLNVGPGVGLVYRISSKESVQCDKEGIFEKKIKGFLCQALSVIGNVPEVFKK
jgi:hypothetical protein